MRVGAGRGADAEGEGLRCGRERSGLVGAEAILAGLDHGELPPRARLTECSLGHAERDETRQRVGPDVDRAQRATGRILEPLPEALYLDQRAPGGVRRYLEVAGRVGGRRQGVDRRRIVDVDVDQLRAQRAAEGR